MARGAGANALAGAPLEAAQDAAAMLLAVHWSRTSNVLKQAGDLSGKGDSDMLAADGAANTKLIVANTS